MDLGRVDAKGVSVVGGWLGVSFPGEKISFFVLFWVGMR